MIKNIGNSTFQHLQLGAGAMLYDVDIENITSMDELRELLTGYLEGGGHFLGATRGGGFFKAIPVVQKFRVDGAVFDVKGGMVVEGWDISLNATFLEFTPEGLERLLPSAALDDTDYCKQSVNINNYWENQFLRNVVWVGDWADHGLIAIELKNAVNRAGLGIAINETGEGAFAASFVPCKGDYFDSDAPPFNIYFLSQARDR